MNTKTLTVDLNSWGTPTQIANNLFNWEDSNIRVPSPVYNACTTVYNNKLFVIGGFLNSNDASSDQIQIYDFNTKAWSNATLPMKLGACAGDIRDNEYFLFGGNTVNSVVQTYTDRVHKINLDTLAVTVVGTLPTPYSWMTALGSKTSASSIFVVGGQNQALVAQDSMLRYDIRTNTFTSFPINWPMGTTGIKQGALFSYVSGVGEAVTFMYGLTQNNATQAWEESTIQGSGNFTAFDNDAYFSASSSARELRVGASYCNPNLELTIPQWFMLGGTTNSITNATIKMINQSVTTSVQFPNTLTRTNGNLVFYNSFLYSLNGKTASPSDAPIITRMDLSPMYRKVVRIPPSSTVWQRGTTYRINTMGEIKHANFILSNEQDFLLFGEIFNSITLSPPIAKSTYNYTFTPSSPIPQDSTHEYLFNQNGNDTKGPNNFTSNNIVFIKGIIKDAVKFNQQSSSLITSAPLITTDIYTIGCWMYFDYGIIAMNESYMIFTNKNNLTDAGISFYKDPVMGLCFQSGSNSNEVAVISPYVIPLGKWAYTAFTCDGSRVQVTFDGSVTGQTTITTSSISAQPFFKIGSKPTDIGYYKGGIDQMRFWNRLLTPAEKNALMQENE